MFQCCLLPIFVIKIVRSDPNNFDSKEIRTGKKLQSGQIMIGTVSTGKILNRDDFRNRKFLIQKILSPGNIELG